MNPQTQFCHNPACCARGQMGPGNIVVHSHVEQRYRCTICGQTFAATKGTPFYRLRTAAELVTTVLTLLCHGCPIQAIVAAFGLDERTVAAWVTRAGRHCQQVQQHVVQQGQVDLQHVQADDVSPQRDRGLITTLVQMVRSCARSLAILVCVDELASYVTAFLRVFRYPARTGGRGRPRLGLEPGVLLGQMVKRYARRHVVSVEPRMVRGTVEAIVAGLEATGSGTGLNTASIERLNATFRSALTPLVRRGRAMAHTEATLSAGMWLVGCAYNFCWLHVGLRVAAPASACWKWQERTPAMAAGLTNHRWTMRALLRYQVALSPWVAAKRPGRPPKQTRPPARALAA